MLSADLGTLGSVTDAGDGTYTATLTSAPTVGTANVTGTVNGTAIGHPASVPFVPGPAAKLVITSSTANLTSGATRNITAAVEDANGNVVTGDNSTSVTFTQTSGTGSVSGTGSATAASGVATKTVTGVLAGSVTVTAHSGSLTDDTSTFTVVAGAASKLAITSSTANLSSGSTRDITAEVQDAAGNLVTGDNSTSVGFTQTSGSGSVSGAGSATAASGVATKTVTGVLAGSVTVTAHSGSLTDGTSTFTVVAGAASKLVVTSSSGNLRAARRVA